MNLFIFKSITVTRNLCQDIKSIHFSQAHAAVSFIIISQAEVSLQYIPDSQIWAEGSARDLFANSGVIYGKYIIKVCILWKYAYF